MKKISLMYVSVLVLTVLSAALFSGCSYYFGASTNESSGSIDASYVTFSGDKDKTINLKEGQTLVLDYTVTVKKGSLDLSVTGPDKEKLWEATFEKDGADKIQIPIKKTGDYKIIINGHDTGGGYHIKIER